jgi:hypothetical protein
MAGSPSARWHPRCLRCSRSWLFLNWLRSQRGHDGWQIAEINGAAWNVSLERSGDDGATW